MIWKITHWCSVAAVVIAVPLTLIGHRFGWTLVLFAFGGLFIHQQPEGEWAPYQFPIRKERRACVMAGAVQFG